MHVAQVLQGRLFFVGHALREVGISKALIACGFWHILKDTKFLFDHLLTVPGHLAHFRQNIVLDVIALLWRQFPPGLFSLTQIALLRGGHVIPLTKLLANLVLLVGREILERFTVLQYAIPLRWRHRAHLIDPRARGSNPNLLTWR